MAGNQRRLVIPLKTSLRQGYIAVFLLAFTLLAVLFVSVGVWLKCALLAVWLVELIRCSRLVFNVGREFAVTGLSLQKLAAQSDLTRHSNLASPPSPVTQLGETASNLQRGGARYRLELRFGRRWERVAHIGELVVTPYVIFLSARLSRTELISASPVMGINPTSFSGSTSSSSLNVTAGLLGWFRHIAMKFGAWQQLRVSPRVYLVLSSDSFLSDDDFRHLRIALAKS